jgi:polyhydroxyalkanoate synthesis regulator phasin
MATETNFLGFRQVSKAYFDSLTSAAKKNYLWFVRDLEATGTTIPAAVYFGTRKYGEVNQDEMESTKLDNLIESMGSMVNSDGTWSGVQGLSGETVTEVIEALKALVEAEAAARQEADEELVEAINQESELRAEGDEILSARTDEVEERVSDLEQQIADLKSLGILHFVDVASAISGETIIILMDGTEVEASSANTGDIYMIDKAEYASNGVKWVDLGDESQFAQLKEALAAEIAARQAGDAELDDKIGGLDARVDALESDPTHIIMGDDLEEYDEGEQDVIVNSQLSNVATNGGTALIQSDATLDGTVVVSE